MFVTKMALLAALMVTVGIAGARADVFQMGPGLTSHEFVPVGSPGNTGELSGAGAGGYGPDCVCGEVAYIYNMGKFEVTAGQYTEFLNSVARTDTYGLYNTWMGDADGAWGCDIRRSGDAGDYTYSVAADWANRPVNYVSWADAARFANWLTNGQPTGDQGLTTTEDGSYYLNGATSNADLPAVTRRANARYVIPSEDEWYKAAYHKNNGVTGDYGDYPTGTNAPPSNVLISPDPGNNANFCDDTWTIDSPFYRTEVGEFENSASPYGTFDQGGNVWEWNEAVLYDSSRGLRGGSFNNNDHHLNIFDLRADGRYSADPGEEYSYIGFRIAEVPEPATLALLALGGLAALLRRQRQ